ncbi:MAG: hypothetical protein JSU00_29975 [Acidobacteria bacterium]|nr:hypothetical protein [Acidobacteriota bacterium]
MEAIREDLPAQVHELARAIAELKERMSALERAMGGREGAVALPPPEAPAVDQAFPPPRADTGGLAPLFGWAFLGLAGAYLLRGATESGALPGALGAAAGIVYAGVWLFLAARKAGGAAFASAVHGATAALILAPMLWESVTRLHLIGVRPASGVLVLFSIWGLAIAWRDKITAIAWIATVCGLLTAMALFRETQDIPAWMLTTLIVAATVEFSACRDHWLGLRWMVALLANLNVAALVFVMVRANDPDAPSRWATAIAIALAGIYVASAVDRSALRRLRIDWFEIVQPAIAFLLLTGGSLRIASVTGMTTVPGGAVCLLGAAGCYVLALGSFEAVRRRNFIAYSTAAFALFATGCFLLMNGAMLTAALAAASALALVAGSVAGRTELRIHGALYLLLSTLISAFWLSTFGSVARIAEAPLSAACWIVPVSAAAGCAAVLRVRLPHASDRYTVAFCGGALLWGVAGLAAHAVPADLALGASLRTALPIVLAIGAGWAGQRFKRDELAWLAYLLLGAAGLKLLVEDLRSGRSIPMFVSLIVFGGALLALPKLRRASETPKSKAAVSTP